MLISNCSFPTERNKASAVFLSVAAAVITAATESLLPTSSCVGFKLVEKLHLCCTIRWLWVIKRWQMLVDEWDVLCPPPPPHRLRCLEKSGKKQYPNCIFIQQAVWAVRHEEASHQGAAQRGGDAVLLRVCEQARGAQPCSSLLLWLRRPGWCLWKVRDGDPHTFVQQHKNGESQERSVSPEP